MALTLLEASKLNSGTIKEATLIELYPRSSEVLRVLPFQTINGNAISYNLEDRLPGVGFRGVNEGFDESTGIINPQTEALKIGGGDLDVDKFILDTQGQEQRDLQERLKVKALALNWTRQFIKGNSITNPRVFDGLEARIGGGQLLTNVDAAKAPIANLNLLMLDRLIKKVDGPTHLIMHGDLLDRLTMYVSRNNMGHNITRDINEFGNQITSYRGLPILEIGMDDTGEDILQFDGGTVVSRTDAGAAGPAVPTTSIYCVSIGEGKLQGIQGRASGVAGMSIRDLGELQDKPVVRTRVEWYSGLMIQNGRAAARLQGVGDVNPIYE